jgi:quercetin dioxygenase-like cupin family protein
VFRLSKPGEQRRASGFFLFDLTQRTIAGRLLECECPNSGIFDRSAFGRDLRMETKPQRWQIASAVQVQPQAVVSRTLINEKSGTVTLFGFDQGQGLSEHTAPYDALVQVVDGAMEITISGEVFQVNPGELLLMPADQPHSLKALLPSRMILVMIRS